MFWVQSQIRGKYQSYSQVQSSLSMTGAEVAQAILHRMEVENVAENREAKSVLQAAAWTYVATVFYAVLQLIQLLIMSRSR